MDHVLGYGGAPIFVGDHVEALREPLLSRSSASSIFGEGGFVLSGEVREVARPPRGPSWVSVAQPFRRDDSGTFLTRASTESLVLTACGRHEDCRGSVPLAQACARGRWLAAVGPRLVDGGLEVAGPGIRLQVVSECPPAGREVSSPLEGPSGQRLARLMGFGDLAEARRSGLLCVNLSRRHVRKWRVSDARAAAARLPFLPAPTILLGRRVAEAYGLDSSAAMSWTTIERRRAEVAVVPHPSGRSRWWNDARRLSDAREFLERAARRTGMRS